MGLSCFACFDGGNKRQRQEEDRLASAEARAKAAEAAQNVADGLMLSLLSVHLQILFKLLKGDGMSHALDI
ncbi:hypothetical protein GH714_004400 [Hevea brasiliensis]|uniref:Uncharacterized protein n=1 Tax=Hevea brasiliensis TaxID=3981 RepID=A0A6A6M9U9_HEVBR|nr:hypothetical protein GH714_004400 [Hevea brasiliensis]